MLKQKTQDEYPRSLLREKWKDLRALELKRRNDEIPPDEYRSCRLALLDAIRQIEQVMRVDSECNRNQQTNSDQSGRPVLTTELT